jgi:hypothetical protein
MPARKAQMCATYMFFCAHPWAVHEPAAALAPDWADWAS